MLKENHQQKEIRIRKYITDYGIQDYFKYYKDHADSWTLKSKFDLQEYEFGNPIVNKQTYRKILFEYYDTCTKEVLYNNESIHLTNLGTISILKSKPKMYNQEGKIKLPVDWKLTRELGKKVYFTNDDRDGYVYKWTWARKNMKSRSLSWYKFLPTRKNKRELTQVLKNKSKDFHINPYK